MRLEECETVLAEAVADGVQDVDEDLEQVGRDELVLFGEEGNEHRDDLGQERDVLRLEEIEVAQSVERQDGGLGQGDSTSGEERAEVHIGSDADERTLIELGTLVVSPRKRRDIQNNTHLFASALIE